MIIKQGWLVFLVLVLPQTISSDLSLQSKTESQSALAGMHSLPESHSNSPILQ